MTIELILTLIRKYQKPQNNLNLSRKSAVFSFYYIIYCNQKNVKSLFYYYLHNIYPLWKITKYTYYDFNNQYNFNNHSIQNNSNAYR